MTLALHLYRRVLRRGRLIALIALSSVPGLIYWIAAAQVSDEEARFFYSNIIAGAGFSFAIAVLILTVAVLREERDAGTLPYIYMRPIGRTPMAVSAIAAGIGGALTLALAGWFVSLVAVLAVGAPVSVAMTGLVQYVAAGVGYAAVFVPLGYLVPRAILFGLGFIIVVESIMAMVVSGLAQISIWRISLSTYADIAPHWDTENAGAFLGPLDPGVGGGVAKLVVVVLLGLVTLTWALRRRDAL